MPPYNSSIEEILSQTDSKIQRLCITLLNLAGVAGLQSYSCGKSVGDALIKACNSFSL